MRWQAKWIQSIRDMKDVAPTYYKVFRVEKPLKTAMLHVTAQGVYEAVMNQARVGEFILAPGYTVYPKRLQYQSYEVKKLLKNKNVLEITVGKGWYRSLMPGWYESKYQAKNMECPAGLLVQLDLTYEDGSEETIISDDTWMCKESSVRFSEIYDGEIYDASFVNDQLEQTKVFTGPDCELIKQQGEEIREQERLTCAELINTPKGEVVLDFGQNLTGYIEVTTTAKKGDLIDLSFAEVLDQEGNFYNANYRDAKSQYHYICKDGEQSYKPKFTFYGFRYVRVNSFPGGLSEVTCEKFKAIAIYSDMKRTGFINCSDSRLNQLFSNVIWGQKGNFVDVPTDCPQRDERLGWTGDAQVFIKTACLNYDTEKFYTKWLADLAANQGENGCVGHVIPDLMDTTKASAAWGDAATICPWQLYLAYGNEEILKNQYQSMTKWVEYITTTTTTTYLWTGGKHFGDWLGLDAPEGSYKGSTDESFIATAFYAYSTSLVIKAGKVLNKNVSYYEDLYEKIVDKFRHTYETYHTQTECVLAVYFHLAKDCKKTVNLLVQMIKDCGGHLQTGFVGTPYLLHVLSDYGFTDLAYTLLMRDEYPSWLYSVKKGATTIWEHWDGIKENGDFWSTDMNSFNHYAYGAVLDWVYTVAAGINTVEEAPGYKEIIFTPHSNAHLDWLTATLDTRHGKVVSSWKKQGEFFRYEITTPVAATIVIEGKKMQVKAGSYIYFSKVKC